MALDLVVLGDSVMWGQGLRPEHKSAALVAAGLNATHPGIQPVMLAHSGAEIDADGHCDTVAFPGEIPKACPSILHQIGTYQGDPLAVPVVMLNGGINDVDIRTILSPFTDSQVLARDIQQYCYADMGKLLIAVKARFSNPATKIVVSSYFPILTEKSDVDLLPHLLETLGAPLPALLSDEVFEAGNPLFDKVAAQCLQFWHGSSQALAKAVSDVNLGTGPRCYFADVPFTENNAVFAPDAWLFGVGPLPDFAAQDEVADVRRPQCDVAFPGDFFAREKCYRASAGHPNPKGAQQFAAAILKAIA